MHYKLSFAGIFSSHDCYDNARFVPHVSPKSLHGLARVNISLATTPGTNTLFVAIGIRLLRVL